MSRREDLIENIKAFISGNGYAPTVRELASLMDTSKTTVERELQLARANGQVDWIDGKSRTLRIIGG